MTLVVSETQQVLQRLGLDGLSFISAWLIRPSFKQENFMSRCCINFTILFLGPPGVLGIWGEGLFIFRELGSTANYFRGAGEQAHTFGDLGSTAKK